MTLCNVDQMMIFTGDKGTMPDKSAPVPRGWIATEPPKDMGINQWGGDHWVHLDEYPKPPPPQPTPPPCYSPDKIICAVDALGKSAELEAMLAAAIPRIRLRWQKVVVFSGDDPDFIGMVAALQAAWGLTDEQRAAFLAACEEI